MSVSVENFLKTVYQFGQDPVQNTRPGNIARSLEISQAATTDMARNLAGKGLLKYKPYRELKLTKSGEERAIRVIRKHRLWETFLFRTLRMSLHEIHREAEMLEHQTSDFLAGKIAEYLDDPSVDPHGDPIPDHNGILVGDSDSFPLSIADAGKKYIISRLKGSSKEFFTFCSRNSILVGSSIHVLQQYPDSGITEAEINSNVLLLSKDISSLIQVKC